MKSIKEPRSRFPLSSKPPSQYPIQSNEDAVCVDIANKLGESDMRYVLARRHQLGIRALEEAFAIVKEEVRKGTCRNPSRLFNFLLTQKFREKDSRPENAQL